MMTMQPTVEVPWSVSGEKFVNFSCCAIDVGNVASVASMLDYLHKTPVDIFQNCICFFWHLFGIF